jgi:hypothetical protein
MSDSGNSYPHWLGLLKWSLSQTDPVGAPSDFSAMTAENRAFLDAVMKDLVKDEPGELQKILKVFQEMFERGVVREDDEHILELLQDAQLIVDQIDMANVFLKFGGAVVLKNILNSDVLSDACKCTASVICGELAQNNPVAQIEMLKFGLLDQLAVLCASPTTSTKLCTKSLYGISCIVRGSRDGEERFCSNLSGPSLLQRLLQRQDDMCSKRVMFLSNALVLSDFTSPIRIQSVLSGIVPDIFRYLDSSDIDTRETCLALLLSSASSAAGKSVLSPSLLTLQSSLDEKLSNLTDEDDYEKRIVRDIIHKLSEEVVEESVGAPPSGGGTPSSSSLLVLDAPLADAS